MNSRRVRGKGQKMNVNPMKLLQLKGAWDAFQKNHPKFPLFMKAVGKGALTEGTVLEINVTTAERKTLSTNLKITAQDMEMFRQIQEMVSEG